MNWFAPIAFVIVALVSACAAPPVAPPAQVATSSEATPTAATVPAATEATVAATEAAPTAAATVATEATTPVASTGEEIQLNIICRCVTGGTGANTVRWFKEFTIPEFEKQMQAQGKNVKVNLVEFGGSDDELKQRYALDLQAGRGEDVMGFDGFWVPEFVAGGLLKPLDEVAGGEASNWEGWSHIPEGLQSILGYQGQRYGIPAGTDVRAIWYRKDILKEAGLPDNWQPTSWDELLEAARKIKAAKPDVVPIQLNAGTAMGEATTLQGWYMALLGTGANVYDFDTNKYVVTGQPILDALNLYKTIYIDEKLGDARLQLLQDGRQRSFLDFRDGKIAMLIEGDFLWRSVLAGGDTKLENRDELVGWAKMPAMAPGTGIRNQDFVTASGGTGYVLNPNTKHPAEAWALLSFMFSKPSLDYIQGFEPRIRARDDVAVPNEPVMTTLAQELLPLTAVRPNDPNYSKVVSPAIQQMTERIVSGEMTPEQAMEAYAKAVTDAVGADMVQEAK